ncbi:MAG: protein-export chaperone SecB [Fusobacterium sp.]
MNINNAKSEITFNEYWIENMIFNKNINFEESEEGIPLKIDISPGYKKEKNNLYVSVTLNLFEKNNSEFPFYLTLKIVGVFTIEENISDLKLENYKKINCLAILFPYIRALVSTITANANVPPLILPPLNITKLVNN